MSSRKTNNSILVLATLGVYLGLVLVGATPQVLAQAAMTKQFNVKDEVEVKDDLDTKPDGCKLEHLGGEITDLETKYLWFNDRSISEYRYLLEQVLDAYPETVSEIDISWISKGDLRPSRQVVATTKLPIDDTAAHELNSDVILVGNGLPGKAFSFSVFRNHLEDQFKFESRSIPYDSPLIKELYSKAFDYHRCLCALEVEQVILKHTVVNVEGTNLVITTRLPRGSLDTLLASNAK